MRFSTTFIAIGLLALMGTAYANPAEVDGENASSVDALQEDSFADADSSPLERRADAAPVEAASHKSHHHKGHHHKGHHHKGHHHKGHHHKGHHHKSHHHKGHHHKGHHHKGHHHKGHHHKGHHHNGYGRHSVGYGRRYGYGHHGQYGGFSPINVGGVPPLLSEGAIGGLPLQGGASGGLLGRLLG
ncbi:hypothetical protein H4R35_002313 [Dimargaris xerosporica]|nr:hypothetical protein H4R35_002313 [Dimargaris xerosporica]